MQPKFSVTYSQVARKYLTISASSSLSERLFRKAGQVVSSKQIHFYL